MQWRKTNYKREDLLDTNIKMITKTIRCVEKHLMTASLYKLPHKHLWKKKREWIKEINWIQLLVEFKLIHEPWPFSNVFSPWAIIN